MIPAPSTAMVLPVAMGSAPAGDGADGLGAAGRGRLRGDLPPPGGRAPILGTNPFSIGFPSQNGPVVYDIGTAAVMWGEVQLMARLGHELPEGVGYDADGNPTRDAAKAT